MMSNEPLIEETLRDAQALVRLLEKPEPGLMMWQEAVVRALRRLALRLTKSALTELVAEQKP